MTANKENKPLVSILLPAYNAALYLREAIDSILHQTYSHFELIIINDGSVDQTEEIILSYSDRRIRYIKNESNLGLIDTLNMGIDNSTGQYIIRMDADDISIYKRIERQVEFMEKHRQVAVAGSWYYAFTMSDGKMVRGEADSDVLKATLLFNTCLCHPATIIRKSVLDKYKLRYNPKYKHLEDYELWIRISKVADLSNVKEFLFRYRTHDQQISQEQFNYQKEKANILRAEHLTTLGFVYTEKELEVHNTVACNTRITSISQLKCIESWFLHLIQQNKEKNIINCGAFNQVIGKMWSDTCGNTSLGWRAYRYFMRSSLRPYTPSGIVFYLKLAAKCWVRREKAVMFEKQI